MHDDQVKEAITSLDELMKDEAVRQYFMRLIAEKYLLPKPNK